jgi:hypothetical protein
MTPWNNVGIANLKRFESGMLKEIILWNFEFWFGPFLLAFGSILIASGLSRYAILVFFNLLNQAVQISFTVIFTLCSFLQIVTLWAYLFSASQHRSLIWLTVWRKPEKEENRKLSREREDGIFTRSLFVCLFEWLILCTYMLKESVRHMVQTSEDLKERKQNWFDKI